MTGCTRRVQDEQRHEGEHDEHSLSGRPLPRHGAQPAADVPGVQAVPHAPVHVPDDAAGQRAVEELGAVVRGDRRPQGQADAQPARDGLPAPGRTDGGQRGDRGGDQQRPGADLAHTVQERAGAQSPDEDREDRGTAEWACPGPGPLRRGSHGRAGRLAAGRTAHPPGPRHRRRRPAPRPGVAPWRPSRPTSSFGGGPPGAVGPGDPRRVTRRQAPRRGAPASSGGTSRPGEPSAVQPSASGTPPTAVAITGRPTARASVTTMPYASIRVGNTRTSAAWYSRSSSSPTRGPEKTDPVEDAGPGGLTAEAVDERRVTVQRTHEGAAPRRLRDAAQRLEQEVVSLVRDHGGDAEQPAAAGSAGRLVVQVRAGTGDLHPLRREPVAVQQPLAGPRAGRHDGTRLREDGTFGLLGDGDAAEGHVHQDDKPQPGGLRHQDGSGGGRDQPVEQDEPAVRHGRDRPCQPGQGRRDRAGATGRARRAPARPSPPRRVRRRSAGHTCCRRSAGLRRRCRRGRRRGRSSRDRDGDPAGWPVRTARMHARLPSPAVPPDA